MKVCSLAFVTLLLIGQVITAQRPGTGRDGKDRDAPNTDVTFELLTNDQGQSALAAQQWGRLFEKLGVKLRIRRAILDDKAEVTETKLGRIRVVKAIGHLDSKGRIVFPDHVYSQNETAELAEWIRELQTYGAKGSPEGKPAFGLEPKEFGAVFAALSKVVEKEVAGLPLDRALLLLEPPREFPLRISVAGEKVLKSVGIRQVIEQPVAGLTKGTAFAIVLNEYGLGLRPLRTPRGSVQLTIDALDDPQDCWPIGWPMPEEASRQKTAPKLFQLVPVNFEDVPLRDVVDAVSIKADIPIYFDFYSIREQRIDISRLKVSYPPRKTSYSLLLRGVTVPHKLNRKLTIDEQGTPFVLISTLEELRSNQ